MDDSTIKRRKGAAVLQIGGNPQNGLATDKKFLATEYFHWQLEYFN